MTNVWVSMRRSRNRCNWYTCNGAFGHTLQTRTVRPEGLQNCTMNLSETVKAYSESDSRSLQFQWLSFDRAELEPIFPHSSFYFMPFYSLYCCSLLRIMSLDGMKMWYMNNFLGSSKHYIIWHLEWAGSVKENALPNAASSNSSKLERRGCGLKKALSY